MRLLAATIALILGGSFCRWLRACRWRHGSGSIRSTSSTGNVMFLPPSFAVMIVSFMSPTDPRRRAGRVRVSIALIVATLLLGPEVKGCGAGSRWSARQHPGLRRVEARFRRDRGVAVCRIDEAAGNASDLDGAGALDDAGKPPLVMEPDFGQTMLILMVWAALFLIAGMRMDSCSASRAPPAPDCSARICCAARRGPHQAIYELARATRFRSTPRWKRSGTVAGSVWARAKELPVTAQAGQSHRLRGVCGRGGRIRHHPAPGATALFAFVVIRTLSRAYSTEDMFARFAASGLVILFSACRRLNINYGGQSCN